MDKSVNILIVDDSEMERVNLLYQLKEVFNEQSLFFADTIDKAWAVFYENTIDVALIDIYLPGKNGADLINDMLFSESYKDIPIIVITGTSEDSFVKTSYEKHVSEYLHKPIDNKKLISAITKCVNKKSIKKKAS